MDKAGCALVLALLVLVGGALLLGQVFPNESFPNPTPTAIPTVTPNVPTPTIEPIQTRAARVAERYPQVSFLKDMPEQGLNFLFVCVCLISLYILLKIISIFIPPVGSGLNAVEVAIGWTLGKILWLIGLLFKGIGYIPNLIAIGAFLLLLIWPHRKH